MRIKRFDDKTAINWLREGNPELRALRIAEDRERLRVRLSKKNYIPDITLSAQYIKTGEAESPNVPETGKDPISIGFSINIPIWANKYNAEIRERYASLDSIMRRRIDKENELLSKLKLNLYKLRDSERKIRLYEDDLIPKAKEAFNQSIEDFKAGRATFSDVVDAERVMLEFELSLERAKTDRLKAISEIEALLGKELMEVKD